MATVEYSPVQSLKIRNFRQLGSVDLEFDRPIITVVGENDAGKTSIMLALGVVGLNAHGTKQKKYIKRGTSGFGLSLGLADGTEIRRIKTATQNSLQIFNGEQVILNLFKFDNPSLQPLELEKVMGLLKDSSTGEILNIRTYNDRLIFAQTTSGDNYKIVYELLKVSNLVRAIKRGNEEANSLKKQINNNTILIEHTLSSLRDIKPVNIEPLIIMRNNLKGILATADKAQKAKDKKATVEMYNRETLQSIQSLKAVDSRTYEKAYRALEYLKNIKDIEQMHSISLIGEVQSVDVALIQKARRALSTLEDLNNINIKSEADLATLSEIDTGVISRLKSAVDKKHLVEGIANIEVTAEAIDTTILDKSRKAVELLRQIMEGEERANAINQEIGEISEKLKQSGVAYKICPNCGEVVIVDD